MSIRTSHRRPPRRSGSEQQIVPSIEGVRVLSPEEAWEFYDEQARKHLGMSADEFDEAWERGEFKGRIEDDGVLDVVMVRTPRPSA